jgi:hypothetical protein
MIGTAYAAADEYARSVAARPLLLEPDRTRADLLDCQRHLGEALGTIHTAEAALRQTAEDWMDTCRRNASGEAPFTLVEDNRLALTFLNAGRMAWDVLQGAPFRTAGSRDARGSRGARDSERMQRCFRDAATYWTHVGASMAEPLMRRVGCDRLGLPSDHIPLIPRRRIVPATVGYASRTAPGAIGSLAGRTTAAIRGSAMDTPAHDNTTPARRALDALAENTEDTAALDTLASSEVLVPVPDDAGQEVGDSTTVALPVLEQADGAPVVPVFTSEPEMAELLPSISRYRLVPLGALAAQWPADDLSLTIDASSEHPLTLTSEGVRTLLARPQR